MMRHTIGPFADRGLVVHRFGWNHCRHKCLLLDELLPWNFWIPNLRRWFARKHARHPLRDGINSNKKYIMVWNFKILMIWKIKHGKLKHWKALCFSFHWKSIGENTKTCENKLVTILSKKKILKFFCDFWGQRFRNYAIYMPKKWISSNFKVV